MAKIDYRSGKNLDLDQFIELYHASTLGERRPVQNRDTMKDMLENANLVITAWDGEMLVGIARTLTDFTYVGYLADLAVRASHQRRGIGIELIRQNRADGAKLHAGAARGTQSCRLLPKDRLHPTWQRLDFTCRRTPSRAQLRAQILSGSFSNRDFR